MTPEVSHSNSYIDDNNQYAPFLVEDKIKELGDVYKKVPD